ncbi:hypothetical protein K458DRAFT_394518 [Lentithecium fluviatile CBS 122367]|uniref:Uncharacterized protein n=1 Tax=Lentithecium fluviatile CBS 122367 TaxID=1168545 RepID=A0A6G1ILP8_9PLEO|nr:hypothetical protein K458DRAFT_394518 [Lentithecium fluviatile CBS 122367]
MSITDNRKVVQLSREITVVNDIIDRTEAGLNRLQQCGLEVMAPAAAEALPRLIDQQYDRLARLEAELDRELARLRHCDSLNTTATAATAADEDEDDEDENDEDEKGGMGDEGPIFFFFFRS